MNGRSFNLVGLSSLVANIIHEKSTLRYTKISFLDFLSQETSVSSILCCRPEMSYELHARLVKANSPVYVICSASANSLVADSFEYSRKCKKFYQEVYSIAVVNSFVRVLVCGQFKSIGRNNELLVSFEKFDACLLKDLQFGYPNTGGIGNRSDAINVIYELLEAILSPRLCAAFFKYLSKEVYGYNRL